MDIVLERGAEEVAGIDVKAGTTHESRRPTSVPEIEDLRLTGIGHEEARRLDVAMDDPLAVRRLERLADLPRHLQQPLQIEAGSRAALPEGLPFEQFHNDEMKGWRRISNWRATSTSGSSRSTRPLYLRP